MKFEQDASLQTEELVHDNSCQTDQQQWLLQLLSQMQSQLSHLESMTVTTENIISMMQNLEDMNDDLKDVKKDDKDENAQAFRDTEDRINALRSKLWQSNILEKFTERLMRMEDKDAMTKILPFLDKNSQIYKRIKAALEKSEAEVNSTLLYF